MVKLGDWMSEGFNMLKEQFWAWVAVTLVFFLVVMIAGATCVGYFLIAGVMMFGMHAVALRQLKGGPVEVGDLFADFGRLLLPGLGFIGIILLVAIPSMFLFGLPMLFIMPLWLFVPHLILEKKMGVIEAMKASQQVVLKDYWWFVLGSFVISFVGNLGTYICYVGLLATMPIMFTSLAVAYRDCFGVEGACSFSNESLARRDQGARGQGGAYY